MKILEISTAKIWGGGEVHLLGLCLGLRRLGHEVAVLCRGETPLAERLARENLRAIHLTEEKDVGGLARLAVSEGMDLLHAHQGKGALLALAVRYLAGRPRAVFTRHALDSLDRDVSRTGLAKIIAVSQAVAAQCRADGFAGDKIRVVHNGVALDHYRPGLPPAEREVLGLPPAGRIVLMCGRLSLEKGAMENLEALLPMLAPLNLHLLFLGDGELRLPLAKRAARAGLAARVKFLGQCEDVRPYLSLADVVVTGGPKEAFGLATLEAMACGCAVVAADAGGVPEVMRDEETGLLVPPHDALALAAAVYRLLEDGPLRARMGRGARERAQSFGEDKMAAATEGVFLEALEAKAGKT